MKEYCFDCGRDLTFLGIFNLPLIKVYQEYESLLTKSGIVRVCLACDSLRRERRYIELRKPFMKQYGVKK